MPNPILFNPANTPNDKHQSEKTQKKLFKEIYPAVFTQPITVLIQHNHPIQFCLKELFEALKVKVAYLNGSTVQKILNKKNNTVFFSHDIDFEIKKTGLTETISKQTAENALRITKEFLLQKQTSIYGLKLQDKKEPWLQLKSITEERNIISIGSLKSGTHIDLYCAPKDEPIYDTADASAAIKLDLTNKKAELYQPFSENIINFLNQNRLIWFSENINFGLMRLSKRIKNYINRNQDNFFLIQKNIPKQFLDLASDDDIAHIIERSLKGEYELKNTESERTNILWLYIFSKLNLIQQNIDLSSRNIQVDKNIKLNQPLTIEIIKTITNLKKPISFEKLDLTNPIEINIAIKQCIQFMQVLPDFKNKINQIVKSIIPEIRIILEDNIINILGIRFIDGKTIADSLIEEPKLFLLDKKELKLFFEKPLQEIIQNQNSKQIDNTDNEKKFFIERCTLLLDFINDDETAEIKLQILKLKPEQFASPSEALMNNIHKHLKKIIQENRLNEASDIVSSSAHLIPSNNFVDFIIEEFVNGKLHETNISIKNKHCELLSVLIELYRYARGFNQIVSDLYKQSNSEKYFDIKKAIFTSVVSEDFIGIIESIQQFINANKITGINKRLIEYKDNIIKINDKHKEFYYDQETKSLHFKHPNYHFKITKMNSVFEFSVDGTKKIITVPDGMSILQKNNLNNNLYKIHIKCLEHSKNRHGLNHFTQFVLSCIHKYNQKADVLSLDMIRLTTDESSFEIDANKSVDPLDQFLNSCKSFQIAYDFSSKLNQYGQLFFKLTIENGKVVSALFEINDQYQTSIVIPFDTSEHNIKYENHIEQLNSTPDYSAIVINSKIMNYIFLDQAINCKLNWNQENTIVHNPNFEHLSNALHGFGIIESRTMNNNSKSLPFKWEGMCNIYGASGNGKLSVNHHSLDFENSFLSYTLLSTIADLMTKHNHQTISFKPIVLNNSSELVIGHEGFLDQLQIDDNHFFTGYLYPDGSMIGLLEYRSTDENHLNSSLKGNFLLAKNLPSETVNGFLKQFNNSYEVKKLGNLYFFPHGKICQSVEFPLNPKTLNSKNIRITEYLLSEKIYFFGHSFLHPTGESNNRYLRPVLTEYFHPNGDFYYSFINNNIIYNFYFTKTSVHSSSIELIGKSSNGKSFDKTKFIILSSGKEEILVTENPSNLNKTQAIQL